MAKISTYGPDATLTNKDKVLGSSYIRTVNNVDEFETKNFTLEELNGFFSAEGSALTISLKDNGGIVRETIDNTTKLAVDLGASSITGQLANADLANSSITINGTAISLGGTVTTPDTQLSDAQVRSKISVTGGGSYNSSTGVITIPAAFTLATGNVTNASVSGQTLTLTRQSTTDVTFTPTANDFTNTLKTKLDNIESNATADQTAAEIRTLVEAATDSNVFTDNDHTKLNNIESNATADQTNAEIRTAVDAATDSNVFTDDDHTKLDGIAAGAEVNVQANWNETTTTSDAFIQNKPTLFSGDYDDLTNKPTLLQLGTTSTTALAGNTSLLQLGTTSTTALAGNTTTISSAQSTKLGHISVTQAVDLDTIESDTATNNAKTSFPGFGTTSGTALEGDTSLFSGDYDDLSNKPTLFVGTNISASTDNDEKGIKVTANAASATIGIDVDGLTELTTADFNDDFLIIYDNNVQTNKKIHPENIIPGATSSRRGGIKIGYTENLKNYPVELDSEKAYVNVPWTDTVYTLPVASSSLGGIKIGYTDNGKNYAVELDGDNEAYVNVPWTDTTYTLPTASSSTLGGVKVGGNLTIDGNGVLNVGAIALTTVQTAANETAHLGLTAQEGDIVVRSDENKSYVHNGGTAGTMADYTELLTPTDAVLSVTTTDGTYINLTPNSAATGAVTVTADLSAVNGTSDTATRFLSKDNTWDVPSYTTETYTQHDNISAADSVNNSGRTYIQDITLDSNGHVTGITSATETVTDTNTQLSDAEVITAIVNSNGISTSNKSTIRTNIGAGTSSFDGDYDSLANLPTIPSGNQIIDWSVSQSGNTPSVIHADNYTDTNTQLSTAQVRAKFTAGTNITITNGEISATDTNTDTNTTYDLSVPASTTKIRLAGSDSTNDDVEIAGGTNVTVTRNSANKLTIAATDTNTDTVDMGDGFKIANSAGTDQFTVTENEEIRFAGSGATSVSFDAATQKVTISSTDTNTDTNTFRPVEVDGSAIGDNETLDLVAGNNITLTETGGEVTIDATDTNTTYSTATSSTLGLVKIGYSENGKNYPVELSSGKMFVNVPWTDTNTNVTNHITNNADDTASGVYTFTNTGNHRFGASGSGNIYIGNVISASSSNKGFRLHSNNADVYFDYSTDSTGSHFYRQYDGSGGIHTRFEHDITSGVFRASSDIVAYFSFSDKRLKENIKPTNYGLNELLELNPVEFKWKEKEGKEIGLIAQEVEEVVPEVIKENKRINDDTLYKQVDYEKLVPVLINSIKELNERIKQLENGDTN